MLCFKYNSTWQTPVDLKPKAQNITTLKSQALNDTYIASDPDYGPSYRQEVNSDGTINITFVPQDYDYYVAPDDDMDDDDRRRLAEADPSKKVPPKKIPKPKKSPWGFDFYYR